MASQVGPTPQAVPAAAGARKRPAAARSAGGRSLLVLVAMAVSGLLAGVGAKAIDVGSDVLDWAHDLGNYPTLFLLAIVLLAVTAPSAVAAALRTAVAFAAMCAGYYAWSWVAAGFLNRESALAWTAVCVTAVPAGAAVLRWATRRGGVLAGAVCAATAALLTTDGALQQMWWALTWADGQQAEVWFRPVLVGVQLLGLVLLLLVLPPGRGSRLWALGLFVPLFFLAGSAVSWAYFLVPGLG